jgi:glycine oxidase
LAARLGIYARIKPIRGQIVLLTSPRSVLSRIVNEGSRYLVPREDGRLLVGSTEEDSGFDRATTAGGVAGLLDFAFSLVPELKRAAVERYWAGLRPATDDGLPYLGRVPDLDNVFVAAGHFRGGLQLSTGTAVTMSQCILGQRPQVDLTAFRLDREASCDHPSPAPRREFASEPARDPRPVPRRV